MQYSETLRINQAQSFTYFAIKVKVCAITEA
nr:MAG TPA: hypothetical protein [Caudoviricetes sp.]